MHYADTKLPAGGRPSQWAVQEEPMDEPYASDPSLGATTNPRSRSMRT